MAYQLHENWDRVKDEILALDTLLKSRDGRELAGGCETLNFGGVSKAMVTALLGTEKGSNPVALFPPLPALPATNSFEFVEFALVFPK